MNRQIILNNIDVVSNNKSWIDQNRLSIIKYLINDKPFISILLRSKDQIILNNLINLSLSFYKSPFQTKSIDNEIVMSCCNILRDKIISIISNKLYYIPNFNIHAISSMASYYVDHLMLYRNNKYRSLPYHMYENISGLNLYANYNIVRRFIKWLMNCEVTKDIHRSGSDLNTRIFKITLRYKSPEAYYNYFQKTHDLMWLNINKIILLSKYFKFKFHLGEELATPITENNTITAAMYMLNYLRLLIRKRANFCFTKVTSIGSHSQIQMIDGDLIEKLMYKLLSVFTTKNASKLVFYYA